MPVVARLAVLDWSHHRRLGLVSSLVVALATLLYLTLVGYQAGLASELDRSLPGSLAVHQADSYGEVYGSRIPAEVGDRLLALGYPFAIPEIHTVVGTSVRNATLLRGVDLAQYPAVESFEVVSGRALKPGDPERAAMVGIRLAQERGVAAGDVIRLRGRDFRAVGIFRTNTYVDNEAWVSLEAAQALLNWGSDVSLYLIPEGGPLSAGDLFLRDLAVVERGESARGIRQNLEPILDVFGVVARVMGVATALALSNVLWRLAWLRRRELAVLRTVGYPRRALAVYLLVQAAAVTCLGALLGAAATAGLAAFMRMEAFGFDLRPLFTPGAIARSLAWLAGITLVGAVIPAAWASRAPLGQWLRAW